jgi:hypothetical protein
MIDIELLDIKDIKLDKNANLSFILNFSSDENLNYLNDYIDLINNNNSNNNKKKISRQRQRQDKINEASRRCRRRKKEHMQIMSNHIKKLHNIISNIELNIEDLKSEISKFDTNILI